MTNKKFKLAAMSLATAVAVSAVGPSASAVTYQLEKGDVTVAENENGAFSYQGEDKDENRTYVDKDTKDNGQIIIKQTEYNNGQYCHCGRKCHEQEWRP